MIRHALIQALKTLSRSEMRRFREMAESPYFNKHRDVKSLVAFLERQYPNFSETTCNKKHLAKAALTKHKKRKPEQAEKHLTVVFTYAWKLFGEFMTQESQREQSLEKQRLQLAFLRRRNLFKIYDKQRKALEKQAEQVHTQDSAYHLQNFRIASEINRYEQLNNTYGSAQHLLRKQIWLDRFFLSEKLKDACELHSRSKITQAKLELPLGEWALQASEQVYEDIPSISIYRRVLRLLQSPSDQQYENLLAELQKAEPYFSKDELQNIYNHLQNHCIEQINAGRQSYLQKALELYRLQLDKGLLLDERGFLPEWHYKNITTIGLRLGEKAWIEKFLQQFKEHLPPDSREEAFRFNLASWHYAVGQYDQVLKLLSQLEYSDFRYYLGAKALLLRTYYELEEYEALNALADAFRQYLKRNRILSNERIRAFRKLLRFTRRALLLKINKDFTKKETHQKAVEKLRKDIELAGPVINKEWLLQKLSVQTTAARV